MLGVGSPEALQNSVRTCPSTTVGDIGAVTIAGSSENTKNNIYPCGIKLKCCSKCLYHLSFFLSFVFLCFDLFFKKNLYNIIISNISGSATR
jgi:hypothetical protein